MAESGSHVDDLEALGQALRNVADDLAYGRQVIAQVIESAAWEDQDLGTFWAAWLSLESPAIKQSSESVRTAGDLIVDEAKREREWAGGGASAAGATGAAGTGQGDVAAEDDDDDSDPSRWYLLAHENPNAPKRANGKRGWYYPSRKKQVTRIVVHTTEGPIGAGRGTAKYFSRVKRPAAAHVIADVSGIIKLLPDTYTAFHAKGANSDGLGIEIQHTASKWGSAPKLEAVLLRISAAWCSLKAVKFQVPPVRLTRDQWLAGEPGFVAHADVDPSRRSDPGSSFDWELFLEMVRTGGVGFDVVQAAAAMRPSGSEGGETGVDMPTDIGSPGGGGQELYTVVRGDNMWDIARKQLSEGGASPSDADVAAYWRKMIELNRPRIRSGDPDLIYPGEELLMPSL